MPSRALRVRSPFVCVFCQRLPLSTTKTRGRSQWRGYIRPSNAPKPVLDLKHIARNPGLYRQNCLDRNYKQQGEHAWTIHELRKKSFDLGKGSADVRQRLASLQKEIIVAKKDGRSETDLAGAIKDAGKMREELESITDEQDRLESRIEDLALALPNLSSTQTPNGHEATLLEVVEGDSETAVREKVTSHVDIAAELDLVDFAGAGTTSGWGWYFLKNEAALLEQALVQYALATLHKRGWQIVSPPSVVYSHIAAACGFQPRDQHDEQQIYRLEQPEKDKTKPSHSLAATAEIPIGGMNASRTLTSTTLPLKTAAVSRCYRAEAGARGVDTKGLYRVHEFTKVEMFAWTMPDELGDGEANFGSEATGLSHSEVVWREMLEVQREILESLGLTFRILEMPTADLGASASRKVDMEAYFPGRREKDEGWGEVTSASICTDYQARRLATRVQLPSGKLSWPHTVNGTALAVPRVIAALLETHWHEKDRTVKVPEVLAPWMLGVTTIGSTGA